MISHYALYDIADISSRFHLTDGLPKGVKPHYNNSPTISAPVVVTAEGARVAKLMKWGLVAQGAKDTNSVFRYKTYNVPSEKIFSRHSWAKLIRESRCLVPANGFYELNGSGKKRAYYAQPKDGSLLAFAGVYSAWQDKEGATHGTFSVITTEATSDLPDISIRMPIIIKPEEEERWLDPTITDVNSIYDMLRPHANGLLTVHEVSPAVHSPKPNQSTLIEPL
jgi:putative SOS response-associated peptidase YedK